MLKTWTIFLMALLFPYVVQAQAQYHHITEYQLVVPNTTLAAESGNNTAAANSFPGCEVTTVTDGQCVNNGDQQASNVSKVNVHTLLSAFAAGSEGLHHLYSILGTRHPSQHRIQFSRPPPGHEGDCRPDQPWFRRSTGRLVWPGKLGRWRYPGPEVTTGTAGRAHVSP